MTPLSFVPGLRGELQGLRSYSLDHLQEQFWSWEQSAARLEALARRCREDGVGPHRELSRLSEEATQRAGRVLAVTRHYHDVPPGEADSSEGEEGEPGVGSAALPADSPESPDATPDPAPLSERARGKRRA
jgi:hypothetical protein